MLERSLQLSPNTEQHWPPTAMITIVGWEEHCKRPESGTPDIETTTCSTVDSGHYGLNQSSMTFCKLHVYRHSMATQRPLARAHCFTNPIVVAIETHLRFIMSCGSLFNYAFWLRLQWIESPIITWAVNSEYWIVGPIYSYSQFNWKSLFTISSQKLNCIPLWVMSFELSYELW